MPIHSAHLMSFRAEVDGAEAEIACDLALFDLEARPKGSTTLFVLGATLNAPDEAGLPGQAERTAVERAQATLAQELTRFQVAIAGHVLTRGTWQTIFYGGTTLEEDLIPTAQAPLRAEGWDDWIHAESDPEWKHYASFLAPPVATRIASLSQRATDALQNSGHDLSAPRTLTHTLAFPSTEAAELSLASIVALGFETASPLRAVTPDYTKATVSRQDPPNHAAATSLMLAELCAPYDGDHLKWVATQ